MRKNIQAQDKNFKEKKAIYTNGDNIATSFELTRRIFENSVWTIEEIQRRQQQMIEDLNQEIKIF